jgi:hypothetical protein
VDEEVSSRPSLKNSPAFLKKCVVAFSALRTCMILMSKQCLHGSMEFVPAMA